MIINIGRDGIKNSDKPVALIYFGRYAVNSWQELFYAAVKTLYIEYPEVINSLVSKDPLRELYLRTTTIDMKEPKRISTILYLEVNRTPLEIVKAIREIFQSAGILNINMSIEIVENEPPKKILPVEQPTIKPVIDKPSIKIINEPSTIEIPKPIENSTANILDVPSFMKNASGSIRPVGIREKYIEQMKFLANNYPKKLRSDAGKFIINRHVTLAESGYRYFIEEVELGGGLSIEISFSDEELKEIADHYKKLFDH